MYEIVMLLAFAYAGFCWLGEGNRGEAAERDADNPEEHWEQRGRARRDRAPTLEKETARGQRGAARLRTDGRGAAPPRGVARGGAPGRPLRA